MAEKTFGEKISDLRKQKMLSQKELGDILGVSNKAVSKWETGEAVPQMKTILKISEYFSVDPTELITGTKYDAAKQKQIEVNSRAVDALQSENEKLRVDLEGAKKSKKKIAHISIIICTLCIMVAVIVALSSVKSENINDSIDDLGDENTTIEFMGEVFVPASELEKQAYDFYIVNDMPKKAVFTDADGEKCDVLVAPSGTDDYIYVNKKNDDFWYINEKNKLSISQESISHIVVVSQSAMGDSLNSKVLNSNQEKVFFDCYNAKEIPQNKAEILKQWTKEDVYNVNAFFVDENISGFVQVGNIFCDYDHNWYFLDFISGEVYKMGGEVVEQ